MGLFIMRFSNLVLTDSMKISFNIPKVFNASVGKFLKELCKAINYRYSSRTIFFEEDTKTERSMLNVFTITFLKLLNSSVKLFMKSSFINLPTYSRALNLFVMLLFLSFKLLKTVIILFTIYPLRKSFAV